MNYYIVLLINAPLVNLRDSLHNFSESHLVILRERMAAIIQRFGMIEKDLKKIQWGKIV